ncbi:MAG: helix-turn-helix domain-containing protein, partial [Nitrospinota bacterium]|nr:helix-turn-helix domain-containing protein [Nitrospinota bacterium]
WGRYMRLSQAEKMEIIRIVEGSHLSVRRTLRELGVGRSTFYGWYQRYLESGYDGLAPARCAPRRFWNRIPDDVRERVVEIALERAGSPPLLAWI